MIRHAYKVVRRFGLIQTEAGKKLAKRGQIPDVVFNPISVDKATYYDYLEGESLPAITQELAAKGYIKFMWSKKITVTSRLSLFL